MESGHYTCSKARRTSPVSDTPSNVEPDAAAPETDTSGPVRLPVTALVGYVKLMMKVAGYGCGGAGVYVAAAS